jgi:hypothetical protein
MNIPNSDVERVVVEVPDGHRHVRTTIWLADGTHLTFQEATMANIVRAFIGVKTHPRKTRVELARTELAECKPGYASWQLLEVEDEDI